MCHTQQISNRQIVKIEHYRFSLFSPGITSGPGVVPDHTPTALFTIQHGKAHCTLDSLHKLHNSETTKKLVSIGHKITKFGC